MDSHEFCPACGSRREDPAVIEGQPHGDHLDPIMCTDQFHFADLIPTTSREVDFRWIERWARGAQWGAALLMVVSVMVGLHISALWGRLVAVAVLGLVTGYAVWRFSYRVYQQGFDDCFDIVTDVQEEVQRTTRTIETRVERRMREALERRERRRGSAPWN